MTDRFRLAKPAIQDIEEIADYIAQQSGLEQSENFLSKLESKFSKRMFEKGQVRRVELILATSFQRWNQLSSLIF